MSIENRMKEVVEAHVRKVKDAARTNLAQQCNDNLAPAVNWILEELDLDYFRNRSEFLDRWT